MTPGRSFLLVPEALGIDCVRLVLCSNLANGCVDTSSDPIVISSAELWSESSDTFDDLLFFGFAPFFTAEGFAHSGTGYSRSNCRRSRFVYTLPFTRSSASVVRSLRNRAFEASEITLRSSSLSIQAGRSSRSDRLHSDPYLGDRSGISIVEGPESRKNSYCTVQPSPTGCEDSCSTHV